MTILNSLPEGLPGRVRSVADRGACVLTFDGSGLHLAGVRIGPGAAPAIGGAAAGTATPKSADFLRIRADWPSLFPKMR